MDPLPNFSRPMAVNDDLRASSAPRRSIGRISIPGRIVLEQDACQLLDGRLLEDGSEELMYRLARPLPSMAPAWRNIVVSIGPGGARTIYRGWAYKALDHRWLPVPAPQDWRQGMAPLNEIDRLFAEAEIRGL